MKIISTKTHQELVDQIVGVKTEKKWKICVPDTDGNHIVGVGDTFDEAYLDATGHDVCLEKEETQ